jgi:hypothetical protein
VRTTAVRPGAAGARAGFVTLRSRGRGFRSGFRARGAGVSERAGRPARCGRSTRGFARGAGEVSVAASSLDAGFGFVFVLTPAEGELAARLGASSGAWGSAPSAGAGIGAGAAGSATGTGTGGAAGAAGVGEERPGSSVSGST